jgi:ATP-binding protein involved in chromosome partitioning
MFQQLGAPILGIIENMSYMPLPDGSIADIFGRGGARRAAEMLGVPFLGELPLFPELRANSDAGDPTRNFQSNPQLRQALEHIVGQLAGEISKRNLQSAPTLTIE